MAEDRGSTFGAACAMLLLFFALLSLIPVTVSGAPVNLAELQAKSDGGYIRINDTIFSAIKQDISDGKFSLFVFFDAADYDQVPRDHVRPLLEEFKTASRSYAASMDRTDTERPQQVFFCLMDFSDSEQSFQYLGVQTLPHTRFFSKTHGNQGAVCDIQGIDGRAEGFLRCLEEIAGLKSGPVLRPRSLQELFGLPVAIFGTMAFLFGSWKVFVLTQKSLQLPMLAVGECLTALLVYAVSISGLMFTVINRMPLYFWSPDRPSKLTMVLRGDEQLGLEGLAAGFLYTASGLALAFLTKVVPLVSSLTLRRLLSYGSLISCGLPIFVLFHFQQWKSGG